MINTQTESRKMTMSQFFFAYSCHSYHVSSLCEVKRSVRVSVLAELKCCHTSKPLCMLNLLHHAHKFLYVHAVHCIFVLFFLFLIAMLTGTALCNPECVFTEVIISDIYQHYMKKLPFMSKSSPQPSQPFI